MGHLKVLVIEAVQKEVQKIWHYCLCALTFQQLHQIVVGGRQEFHQNLTDHPHTGFFYIQKLNVFIEILNNLFAEPLEPVSGRIPL